MTELLLPLCALVIGLALLVKSADVFIEGAASIAVHLKVSPIIIGVIIIGFGTSMPEVIVSILAALDHAPELAVGNAIGSNIANIGLVLGITALVAPVAIHSNVIKRELPLLLGTSLLAGLLLIDGALSRFDGLLLLAGLVVSMAWMIHMNRQVPKSDPLEVEVEAELDEVQKIPMKTAVIWTLGGLIVLMLSARMMVWGAIEIAHYFEVSEAIIGLTIVAIGTSLPELAAGITAARKNEADLMVGNIVGSNLFNLLAVMAMPALIYPAKLNEDILLRDYPIMLIFTLIMLVFVLPYTKKPAKINRIEASLLVLGFISYLTLLYFATVHA